MKNKSIKNRFGHQITVGARVTVSLVNNPARPVGTVKAIDTKSHFAKAYGPQVSFSDLPHTVTADDCAPISRPKKWEYSAAVQCVFTSGTPDAPQICRLPAFRPDNDVNGRLIAAAPELLEALLEAQEMLITEFQRQQLPESSPMGQVCLQIGAAIAKATA